MALIKARFRCDGKDCAATIDLDGDSARFGEYLRSLQRWGKKKKR